MGGSFGRAWTYVLRGWSSLAPATRVATVLQALAVVALLGTMPDLRRSPTDALLLSGASVALAVGWFQLLGHSLSRRPRLLRLCNGVSLLAFILLGAYHVAAGSMLDVDLIGDNVRQLLFPEARRVLFAQVSPWSWAALGAALVAVGGAAAGTRHFAAPPCGHRRAGVVVAAALVACVTATPLYVYSEVAYFARTVVEGLTGGLDLGDVPVGRTFPYVHRVEAAAAPAGYLPDVVLVMMESANAGFVGRSNERGQPYTPFLDSLRDRGFTVDRFYGTSVQTCRGQVAVLASILPSIEDQIATREPPLHLRALPRILAEAGYRTVFAEGSQSLDFDNTGSFMRDLGFEDVLCMDDRFIEPEDAPYVWGWGLQDDRMYRKVLAWMDAERARGERRPWFVVLATASHHMQFRDMPADQRELYPEPDGPAQHFANSMRLADTYLRTLFSELERRGHADSLVVVTGDHSFPAGEHRNYMNINDAYEESFRTPFVLLWPGHVAPRREREVAYSQLDIAPTLLDLLGIRADNHFLGRSMLSGPSEQRPIHLIQPYDGVQLAVVLWPWKYVVTLRSHKERMFNLEADPHEDRDVLADHEGTELLTTLRREIDAIKLNQRLIRADRIWPAD